MDGGELVLGPFCGRPACRRIALSRGVCGAGGKPGRNALRTGRSRLSRHIACDSASRSELVVPLLLEDRVVGVLDVDSPLPARFGAREQEVLENAARDLTAACDWTHAGYSLE